MFAMMSLHPEVRSMSAVTPERRAKASKDTAALFQRLLTQTCLGETRQAIEFEGSGVIEQSFNQLGQVAARGLFSDPGVASGMAEYANYFDQQAMAKIFTKPR